MLNHLLHAVSRTQQDMQKEPSVKTLRSPLFAEFTALRVEWQNSTRFGSTPERRNGNINLSKYFIIEWESNPQPFDFTVTLCATAPRLASNVNHFYTKYSFI